MLLTYFQYFPQYDWVIMFSQSIYEIKCEPIERKQLNEIIHNHF